MIRKAVQLRGRSSGKHAVAVILTEMGADGAKGMLKMKRAGARTIAQDEAGCVASGCRRKPLSWALLIA